MRNPGDAFRAPDDDARAAGTAGAGIVRIRSAAGYVDGDRDGVADDVPDGRVAGEAGELGKLVVVEVAGGPDINPDLLVTGAGVAVKAEESL